MSWVWTASAFWALTGASFAVICEYLYRVLPNPWWHYLWLWIPLQTFIGYTVYRLVTLPNVSLIDAFIFWTFGTIAMRVFVSLVLLDDVVKPGTWVALGLVIAARVAQHFWR